MADSKDGRYDRGMLRGRMGKRIALVLAIAGVVVLGVLLIDGSDESPPSADEVEHSVRSQLVNGCKVRESKVEVDCKAQADFVTCDYSTPSEAEVLTVTNDHDSGNYVVC